MLPRVLGPPHASQSQPEAGASQLPLYCSAKLGGAAGGAPSTLQVGRGLRADGEADPEVQKDCFPVRL
eukprot:229945-Pyramimonas_sp.AAC.1